jgi:hypothetical protein
LHERGQLRIDDLFIDVNKPLTINNTLEGRWISVSWHRKVDPDGNIGFYAFDVGVISSIIQNKVQISFTDEDTSYVVSCKQGTQDVCMVNKVQKYHSMCETVESVHAAVETQREIFCYQDIPLANPTDSLKYGECQLDNIWR